MQEGKRGDVLTEVAWAPHLSLTLWVYRTPYVIDTKGLAQVATGTRYRGIVPLITWQPAGSGVH